MMRLNLAASVDAPTALPFHIVRLAGAPLSSNVGRADIVMGGHFWSYKVPYQQDIRAALEALREQEFREGRFWQPDEIQPGFFGRLLGRGRSKRKRPANITEALKISGATGTRSILDMERVTDSPELGALSPLRSEDLRELFGTEQPTLESIEKSDEFIDRLERWQGVYIILYEQGKPQKIYFAGYSYD